MAGNETPAKTVADALRGGDHDDVITPKDTVKGWNNKRKANNQTLSSLVPFVQLIGLFDEKEYEKMFKIGTDERVPVVFDDKGGPSQEYDRKYKPDPNFIEDIKKQN